MAVPKNSWLLTRPIAHRGLHNDKFPENSIGAFENAVKNRIPIELDIHMIRDGTIVVIHDRDLKRMCGIDREVRRLTKKDLIKCKLNNSEYFIPTLGEVLKIVNGKVPILIEFKSPKNRKKRFLNNVNKILTNYKGDYSIESFNPSILLWYKKNKPHILRGQLSSFFNDAQTKPTGLKRFSRRMATNMFTEPDFVSYDFKDVPNRFIDRDKYAVICWTISSEEELDQVKNDCDNYIFENFIPNIYKDKVYGKG